MGQNIPKNFDERHQLVATLIRLAAIDGQVVHKEASYIWQLAEQLKIPPQEYSELLVCANKLDIPMPETELEKAICLYHILKLIIADNKIVHSEIQYYFELAKLLKLNPNKVEQVGAVWFKFTKSDISIDMFLIYWDTLED